jgi:hypothetical protein
MFLNFLCFLFSNRFTKTAIIKLSHLLLHVAYLLSVRKIRNPVCPSQLERAAQCNIPNFHLRSRAWNYSRSATHGGKSQWQHEYNTTYQWQKTLRNFKFPRRNARRRQQGRKGICFEGGATGTQADTLTASCGVSCMAV